MPRSTIFNPNVASEDLPSASPATRLANGYFSRHPLQGMAALLVSFVMACTAAPAFELLLEGL